MPSAILFKSTGDPLLSLNEMNIAEAVKVVVGAPHGLLRTRETIQRLQAIPQLPGQQPALCPTK